MTFNAGIEAAAQEAFTAITAVCITEDGNTTLANHVTSKIRSLTRPSSTAPVERREVIAEALWRHEVSGIPAAKRARDAEKFLEQSKSTQRKWLGFADAILSLPGSSRDEVLEEAAKIADQAMSEFSDLTDDLGIFRKSAASESATLCGMAAREIASAIRALKSGGAK
jgi:hypothetical protein